MIEKITLKLGGRRITLTQDEYEELREHFKSERLKNDWPYYVPYPVPVYPISPRTPYWYQSPPIGITGNTDDLTVYTT